MPRRKKGALSLVGGLILVMGLLAAFSFGADQAVGEIQTAVLASESTEGWVLSDSQAYSWATSEGGPGGSLQANSTTYLWDDSAVDRDEPSPVADRSAN